MKLSPSLLEAMAIIKGFTDAPGGSQAIGPWITRHTTRHGINVSTAHALIRRSLARESFGSGAGNSRITLTDLGRETLKANGPVKVSV